MKHLVRLLIIASAVVFYVFALMLVWNWHLAGLGLEFAGEYKFNLPTVEWQHTLAFMILRAWFHSDLKYDALSADEKWLKAQEAIWYRIFLFVIAYAAHILG